MKINNNAKLRKSFFGGFKRIDVVKYIEAVNTVNEQRINELLQQINALKEESVDFEDIKSNEIVTNTIDQNRSLKEENDILSNKVNILTDKATILECEIAKANSRIAHLEKEKEYAFTTVASTQAELIRTKELAEKNAAIIATRNDGTSTVYDINELLQELRSYRMIASALKENSRKLYESLARQMDLADGCIESLTRKE